MSFQNVGSGFENIAHFVNHVNCKMNQLCVAMW
jgi:hypothetical protein